MGLHCVFQCHFNLSHFGLGCICGIHWGLEFFFLHLANLLHGCLVECKKNKIMYRIMHDKWGKKTMTQRTSVVVVPRTPKID